MVGRFQMNIVVEDYVPVFLKVFLNIQIERIGVGEQNSSLTIR